MTQGGLMKPLIILSLVTLFFSPISYSGNTTPELQKEQEKTAERKNLFESRRSKARENQQENLRAHEVIKKQKQEKAKAESP